MVTSASLPTHIRVTWLQLVNNKLMPLFAMCVHHTTIVYLDVTMTWSYTMRLMSVLADRFAYFGWDVKFVDVEQFCILSQENLLVVWTQY